MPRTIGELISGGVEQAALEGQGGGMMAFLMAMKGVQGIAETLQNMEAEKRVNTKWEWYKEDREVEVMQREASRRELKRQAVLDRIRSGEGGGEDLDAAGKAQVVKELQAEGDFGVPGMKDLMIAIAGSAEKAGVPTKGAFAAAQNRMTAEMERSFANIEHLYKGNQPRIDAEKTKFVEELWRFNKEAMGGLAWDAALKHGKQDQTPFSENIYGIARGNKGMFSSVMGTAAVVAASKDKTPKEKENAATTWAMLKDEQTGSARKFLNDKDIIDKLPFRENEDGSLTWSYNGKERTQKEIEEVFSNPVNRQRFARKVALGEKEPKVNQETPSQEVAMGIENAMVGGIDNAVEAVAPYLEEANKQTDATRRWEQLKGFFSKTIPGMVDDTKKLYGAIEENPITSLLSVGESFDKTLGKLKAPGLSNYLGKTGRQVDQESPGTSGWSLDAQHTDVEPRAELSGTYPSLPTNPFEAPGMQPSIAQDPNGMMLLLKMLMQAQSNMPAPTPKSSTKFGKEDQDLQNQFKALLQTQGFKSKPKSWDDRAWQPK